MKVTMKVSVSSVDASYGAGGKYDLPDILARQWIVAGYAEAAGGDEQSEATAPVAGVEPFAAPVEAPAIAPRRSRRPATPKPEQL